MKIDDVTETNLSKQAKRDKEAFCSKVPIHLFFSKLISMKTETLNPLNQISFPHSKQKNCKNKSAKHIISLNGPSGANELNVNTHKK